MKLKEYLKARKIKVFEFANFIDSSPSHLYLINAGYRKPGRKTLKLIEMATLGQVTAKDFFPEIEDKEGL